MLHLTSDAIEVEQLPASGARLHRLRVFGHDLLRTPDDPARHTHEPFWWGAFNMVPWCNRIETGPISVGSATVNLPANFSDGSAIHGQLYSAPWSVVDEGTCMAVGGGDGWPWRYESTIRIQVESASLRITQELVNVSDQPMPGGIGLHPWFPPSTELAIRAANVYPTNTNSPTHAVAISGTLDRRQMATMRHGADATWTDLAQPPVELHWPRAGVRATLSSDSPTLHITAAFPAEVGALAVEPQTHAPQGLRRLLRGEPGGLAWLEPGQRLGHTIEMTFEQMRHD